MTSNSGVIRLTSVLQGTAMPPITKCLTRQQTFPPPQPYMRMRYMSATVEMTTCQETANEGKISHIRKSKPSVFFINVVAGDSRSNSSHGSHENISNTSNNVPHYTIPSIAVLSPNNSRPPDFLLDPSSSAVTKPSTGGNKRETEAPDKENTCKMVKLSEPEQLYEKENVDPRKLATTVSLARLIQ